MTRRSRTSPTATAITSPSPRARSTRCASPTRSAGCRRDLPQPRLRRLLSRHDGGVLAATAAGPEQPAGRGELRLLRLRPSVVSAVDCGYDRSRLLGRAPYGGLAAPEAPHARPQPAREPRTARLLQVLQLLRG